MEEFDEPLDRRIRSLAAEKELIQVQVAERRATTPAAIRGLMADLAERRRAGEAVPTPEDDDADKMEGIDEGASVFLHSASSATRRPLCPGMLLARAAVGASADHPLPPLVARSPAPGQQASPCADVHGDA